MPKIKKSNPKRVFRSNVYSKTALKKKLVYLDSSKLRNACERVNNSVNIIVGIVLLSNFVNKLVKCKFCNSENSITVTESVGARKGLATKLNLSYSECGSVKSTMTSKLNKHRGYEVNWRLVCGLRCFRKGDKSAQTLCAVMNLPPPSLKFSAQNKHISESAREIAVACMRAAALEAVGLNDGYVAVFDGSWQKRSHTSLNGIVLATLLDTGKIIVGEVLSKHCQLCVSSMGKEHKCTENYDGYGGWMEVNGALGIFGALNKQGMFALCSA
jgi:hypothetical protein